ncbi:MAG TPA: methylated-DNA--[protein]-cysteine S-methyltransferase [Desulfotomaculum sp.]|nr:methylated-DNA--[protein]-cysteine S-methyltransferase [Desulfotomaculum sp.]
MQIAQRIDLPDGGTLVAVWGKRGLVKLGFPGSAGVSGVDIEDARLVEGRGFSEWQETLAKLAVEYFAGAVVDFAGVPVDFAGYTLFQRRVLSVVRQIPYGEITTYREVARKVGQLHAARAVGQVLKRNRTPLVIPCHRVLSRDGPGGYSCGISFKKRLLRLEGLLR